MLQVSEDLGYISQVWALQGARRVTLAHVVLVLQQPLVVHPHFSSLTCPLWSHGVLCNDHQSCFSRTYPDCFVPKTMRADKEDLQLRREFFRTQGVKMGLILLQ